MKTAAALILPLLVAALIIYAFIKKVNIYKAFIEGAASALPQLAAILPSLAAMLAALSALRGSGALDVMINAVSPALSRMGVAPELAPLIILRPFSGSASLAMMKDVLTSCGADSMTGRTAAVLVGSTETIFYTLTVYFGAAKVTKTRHALPAALIAGAAGVIAGIAFTRFM